MAHGLVEDARKKRYGAESVREVLEGVKEIYAMKGKKVVHLRLDRDKPSLETIHAAILGPHGTLRAPTLRKGHKLIVGFDEATYEQLFT